MNLDIKAFLSKILDAIDYSDDRDVFIKDFMEIVNTQALGAMITSLPQDQQDSLKKDLESNKDNPEKIAEILKVRFSEDQIQKAMEESTKKMIEDWMREIAPTLNDSQRQKLLDLSQELSPTPPPSPAA